VNLDGVELLDAERHRDVPSRRGERDRAPSTWNLDVPIRGE
jgi:hypothetical protein